MATGERDEATVIGRRIARLRVDRGYRSLTALSEASGVPVNTLSALERGIRGYTNPEHYRRIAATLGVTVDALIAPADDSAPAPPPPAALPRDTAAARIGGADLAPADAEAIGRYFVDYVLRKTGRLP